MRRTHIEACNAIAAASEPWKTLGEGVPFLRHLARREAYVYMDNGKPAGFVVFTPDPVFARGAYLRAIGVAPAARRQGIGARLLSFAEELMSRRSRHCYLCVSSFNRPAQAFYRDRGYRRVGTLPGLILPGASEHIYWKKLPPAGKQRCSSRRGLSPVR